MRMNYQCNTSIHICKTNRPAFTMIELVFVIVVLGILAAMALPRLERDTRQEASDNILSAIRYTQHLALMDNKVDNNNPSGVKNWHKAFWQMRFANNGGGWQYIIASNNNYDNNINKLTEAAIDPVNGKYIYASNANPANDESPNSFLSKKYGIDNVDFTACVGQTGSAGGTLANVRHIAFDYLGRLHKGVFGATNTLSTLMHADCTIKFEFEDGNDDLFILIRKDTGYANIVDQNAS